VKHRDQDETQLDFVGASIDPFISGDGDCRLVGSHGENGGVYREGDLCVSDAAGITGTDPGLVYTEGPVETPCASVTDPGNV